MLVDLTHVKPTPQFIRSLVRDGAMFRASFLKRGDKTIRDITARIGVSKGVTGEGLKFNPESRNLLGVFEMKNTNENHFRFIPMEGLISLTVDGNTLLFNTEITR